MNLRNRGCSYPHLTDLWAHVRVTSHYLAELNDYRIGAKKSINRWHNLYSVQIPDVTDYVKRKKRKSRIDMWFILTVLLIMLIKKYYDRYLGYEDEEYDYDYGKKWDEVKPDKAADNKDLENKNKQKNEYRSE